VPDFTRRVAKRITGDLHPGEQVVRSLVVHPPGSMTRGITEAGDAVRGIHRAHKERARHDEEAAGMAARIPARGIFLTVTDVRLLVHGLSKVGTVGEVITEFRFGDVARMSFDAGRFGSGALDVEFADGSAVDFFVAQRQRPQEFVDAFTAAG
jgi:hypothetical protein